VGRALNRFYYGYFFSLCNLKYTYRHLHERNFYE
jgi:hypothetical protein